MKRVLRLSGSVLAALLVLLLAFYISFDRFQPDLTARFCGLKNYVILSGSMEPKLSLGDVITVTRPDFGTMAEGDVVAFRSPQGVIVAHEIAAFEGEDQEFVRTRPYGAEHSDEWDYWRLEQDQVIGEVSLVVPAVGHVLIFLGSPQGITTIVLLLGLLLVLRLLVGKDDPESLAGEDAHVSD